MIDENLKGVKTVTQEELRKSGLKIKDSRKVNMRYKCLKVIDEITDKMYSDKVKVLMQKQGYSVEDDDIIEAKRTTKMKLVRRHLDGKTTKELSGVLSTLIMTLENLDIPI